MAVLDESLYDHVDNFVHTAKCSLFRVSRVAPPPTLYGDVQRANHDGLPCPSGSIASFELMHGQIGRSRTDAVGPCVPIQNDSPAPRNIAAYYGDLWRRHIAHVLPVPLAPEALAEMDGNLPLGQTPVGPLRGGRQSARRPGHLPADQCRRHRRHSRSPGRERHVARRSGRLPATPTCWRSPKSPTSKSTATFR